MMTSSWRRRNTTSLLRWFSPTSDALGLLAENPEFARCMGAKYYPLWSKVGAFARLRLPTPGTFERISNPAPLQIPIDCYSI